MTMKIMTKTEREAYYRATCANQKDVEWNVKSHDVIDAGFCNIEVRKPGITKTVWYDDECENPFGKNGENKKRVWLSTNLRHNLQDFGYSTWKDCEMQLAAYKCCRGDHLSEPYMLIGKNYVGEEQVIVRFMASYQTIQDDKERMVNKLGFKFHTMTEEEVGALAGCLEKLRAEYEKRLETYWKRYSDKIYASGYWRDR